MTLTLESRSPIIVLVADFNPAIFDLPWIALHLFGRTEGEDVELTEILGQNGTTQLRLSFLDGVAINVSQGRTELWALNAEPDVLDRVEAVLLRMLEALPHTPLSAIGCNLIFTDSTPPAAIEDLFATREGLEAEGVLNSRNSGVQLQVDDQVLNFSRHLTGDGARFQFNYHRAQTDAEAYKKFVPGIIQRSLEHSSTLLKSYYQYEGYEVAAFIPPTTEGGEGDNGETTA